MSRPLRVGDRVQATGTVIETSPSAWRDDSTYVRFDGSGGTNVFIGANADCLTVIAPVEPPVGSVVVKDGVAYMRREMYPHWASSEFGGVLTHWDDISDGDVIFTPGGDADVG